MEQIRFEYFAKIDEAVYAEDFLETFQALLDELLECLEESMESQDMKIQGMLDYIAEHYRDDLDLTNLEIGRAHV